MGFELSPHKSIGETLPKGGQNQKLKSKIEFRARTKNIGSEKRLIQSLEIGQREISTVKITF
jgi:hypothetical protein